MQKAVEQPSRMTPHSLRHHHTKPCTRPGCWHPDAATHESIRSASPHIRWLEADLHTLALLTLLHAPRCSMPIHADHHLIFLRFTRILGMHQHCSEVRTPPLKYTAPISRH